MAGDWIPMRLDLYEDPAVAHMADMLGQREEVVVGYLHKVWSWASRQCHAGSVTGVTLVSLGRVTNLHGFPEMMRDAGWLIEGVDGDGKPFVEFPKWENWLSESAKKRAQDNKRQAKRRGKLKTDDSKSCHAPVTQVSRSERDKNVTTVQKRREENNNPQTPKGASRFDASQVEIPATLGTGEFSQAWSQWVEHRKQIGHKLTQATTDKQLAKLAKLGPSAAVETINNSIENGWQGLFPPKAGSQSAVNDQASRPAPTIKEQAEEARRRRAAKSQGASR